MTPLVVVAHPDDEAIGMAGVITLSASRWPGPAGEPQERFLPAAEMGRRRPLPARRSRRPRAGGLSGCPDLLVEVPAEVRIPAGARPGVRGLPAALVRRHEFFWRLAG